MSKSIEETNGLKATHLPLLPQFTLAFEVIIMKLLIFLFVVYLSTTLAYPQDSQPQYKAQVVTKVQVPTTQQSKQPNYKKSSRSGPPRRKKPKQPIGIRTYTYNAPVETGAFSYNYETENDIKQEVVGTMKKISEDNEVLVMRGSYEYIGPNGVTYTVNWVADEYGFRPSARHIPKPVPIPFPEQRKAVAEQIRRAKEEMESSKSIVDV